MRALGSGLAGSSGGIVIRDWRTWRSADTTAMMLIPRVMLKTGIGRPKSMCGWPTSRPPSQATFVFTHGTTMLFTNWGTDGQPRSMTFWPKTVSIVLTS